MPPLSSKTLFLKPIYAENMYSFMLSQPNFPSAELHIQFPLWSHQIRFIQIRNIYIWAGLPHPLAADFKRQNMYYAWESLCREQHAVKCSRDAWNGEWRIQPSPFLSLATVPWTEGSVLTPAVGVLCALPGRPGMCKYVSWTHSPRETTEIIQPMCKKDFAKACDRLSHE